ncbi:MAG: response regulator [Candidatus Omnitrophota bacterium]|jgi:DNA-binding NtrC family response regulator|nr:MAG: response regulator [Candidatus Omnitrophota bacterium]
MNKKTKLLVVDDNEGVREFMRFHYDDLGYDVSVVSSGSQALTMIKEGAFKIMLLDRRMPEMNGMELLQKIREFNQELTVIMMSADPFDKEVEQKTKTLNIFHYVNKPPDINELDKLVNRAAII